MDDALAHEQNIAHMQQVIECLDRIPNREDAAFLARECGLGFYADEILKEINNGINRSQAGG